MAPSDIIQLTLLIVTALGTCTSIWIAISTLKQNSQMIEESTRPCVIIYKDVIDINSPLEYIAIKNFGNSIAHITEVSFDKEKITLLDKNHFETIKAIEYFNDSYLAPGQCYRIPIETNESNLDSIEFQINYSNGVKNYIETSTINLKQDYGIAFVKQHQNGKELKNISNAIQELIKRIS